MRVPGLDFVAIDFETANSYRASVCAVGLAWVRDGAVVDQQEWLIKPAAHIGGGEFSSWNVRIHGIKPQTVAAAPTFAQLYPELMQAIGGDTLVAHNASFDRSCIAKACAAFGLRAPANAWTCTMQRARRQLPQLPNHKLPTVAAALGVTQIRHHDAADDALVAAEILIALQAVDNGAN